MGARPSSRTAGPAPCGPISTLSATPPTLAGAGGRPLSCLTAKPARGHAQEQAAQAAPTCAVAAAAACSAD